MNKDLSLWGSVLNSKLSNPEVPAAGFSRTLGRVLQVVNEQVFLSLQTRVVPGVGGDIPPLARRSPPPSRPRFPGVAMVAPDCQGADGAPYVYIYIYIYIYIYVYIYI